MPRKLRFGFTGIEILVLGALIVSLITGTIATSDTAKKFLFKPKASGTSQCGLTGNGSDRGCWCAQGGWQFHCGDPSKPESEQNIDWVGCDNKCLALDSSRVPEVPSSPSQPTNPEPYGKNWGDGKGYCSGVPYGKCNNGYRCVGGDKYTWNYFVEDSSCTAADTVTPVREGVTVGTACGGSQGTPIEGYNRWCCDGKVSSTQCASTSNPPQAPTAPTTDTCTNEKLGQYCTDVSCSNLNTQTGSGTCPSDKKFCCKNPTAALTSDACKVAGGFQGCANSDKDIITCNSTRTGYITTPCPNGTKCDFAKQICASQAPAPNNSCNIALDGKSLGTYNGTEVFCCGGTVKYKCYKDTYESCVTSCNDSAQCVDEKCKDLPTTKGGPIGGICNPAAGAPPYSACSRCNGGYIHVAGSTYRCLSGSPTPPSGSCTSVRQYCSNNEVFSCSSVGSNPQSIKNCAYGCNTASTDCRPATSTYEACVATCDSASCVDSYCKDLPTSKGGSIGQICNPAAGAPPYSMCSNCKGGYIHVVGSTYRCLSGSPSSPTTGCTSVRQYCSNGEVFNCTSIGSNPQSVRNCAYGCNTTSNDCRPASTNYEGCVSTCDSAGCVDKYCKNLPTSKGGPIGEICNPAAGAPAYSSCSNCKGGFIHEVGSTYRCLSGSPSQTDQVIITLKGNCSSVENCRTICGSKGFYKSDKDNLLYCGINPSTPTEEPASNVPPLVYIKSGEKCSASDNIQLGGGFYCCGGKANKGTCPTNRCFFIGCSTGYSCGTDFVCHPKIQTPPPVIDTACGPTNKSLGNGLSCCNGFVTSNTCDSLVSQPAGPAQIIPVTNLIPGKSTCTQKTGTNISGALYCCDNVVHQGLCEKPATPVTESATKLKPGQKCNAGPTASDSCLLCPNKDYTQITDPNTGQKINVCTTSTSTDSGANTNTKTQPIVAKGPTCSISGGHPPTPDCSSCVNQEFESNIGGNPDTGKCVNGLIGSTPKSNPLDCSWFKPCPSKDYYCDWGAGFVCKPKTPFANPPAGDTNPPKGFSCDTTTGFCDPKGGDCTLGTPNCYPTYAGCQTPCGKLPLLFCDGNILKRRSLTSGSSPATTIKDCSKLGGCNVDTGDCNQKDQVSTENLGSQSQEINLAQYTCDSDSGLAKGPEWGRVVCCKGKTPTVGSCPLDVSVQPTDTTNLSSSTVTFSRCRGVTEICSIFLQDSSCTSCYSQKNDWKNECVGSWGQAKCISNESHGVDCPLGQSIAVDKKSKTNILICCPNDKVTKNDNSYGGQSTCGI